MTDLVIRVAADDDVEALLDLRRCWAEEQGAVHDPGFEVRFRAWHGQERHQRTFWLAVPGEPAAEPAVGMVNLLTFDRMPSPGRAQSRWGYLANMYVRPEHRDRGVGQQLLDALVLHSEAAGFERIVLSPSGRSVPFYRRTGFGPADQLLLRPSSGTTAPPSVVSET